MDLPGDLKNIYLVGGSGQLHKAFKKTLKTSKGKLVYAAKDADIVVEVIEDYMDRRVSSLSPTGRVNEFELIYTLNFVFLDNKGQSLSKKQRLEISRDYFNNQEDVLGKNNEENIIKKEMHRQAVQSIVRRLSIVLKKAKSK
jgi:LPS-assembly lipoprotein